MAGSYAPNGNRYIPQLTTQGTTDYAQIVVNETATDAWMQAVEVWEAATDAWMAERPMYGDTGYTTLAEALTTIGATQASLEIPSRSGAVAVAVSTVIPDNVQLIVREGAYFSVANGATLTINGPLEAGRYQIFSCTGTGNVAFGTTATVYPEWWTSNATPGTTDMTTAIQAAIDSIASGGMVSFTGTYLITSGLTITQNNVTLMGSGQSTTILRENGGTYDTLKIAPSDVINDHITGTVVQDMIFSATTVAPTGGSHIRCQAYQNTELRNLRIWSGFVGLIVQGGWHIKCHNLSIEHTSLYGSITAGTASLELITNTGAVYPNNTWVYFTDCEFISDVTIRPAQIGVLLDSVDSVWFQDCYIGWIGTYGIYIDNHGGFYGAYFNQCYVENCGGNNVAIVGTSVQNLRFSDCHFSDSNDINNGSGIYVTNTADIFGLTIDNCLIWGFYTHGIEIETTLIIGLAIRNCLIRLNNRSGGAGRGIFMCDDCSGFSIQDNQVGTSYDAPAVQAVGITYGDDAFNCIITGNLCVGNTDNTIVGTLSGGAGLVANNYEAP